jgi:hypothetical protein
MNLPILLSGATRPSYSDTENEFDVMIQTKWKDSYHNIINIFVDLVNKNVKLFHGRLHSFQIIRELLHHCRFQDLICNKSNMSD